MSMDSVTGAQFLASLSQCSSPRVADSDQMSIRSEDEGGCPTKVKLMCSYGGRIMPRPHDSQLRYIGGDTRILVVNRNISFADLSVKLSKICGGRSMFAKYKLPYEDFDALVSVICDEDLETMMEEYDRLEAREAPSRLRLFLFPKNSHINNVMGLNSSSFQLSKIGSSTAEQRFLDALNSNDTEQQQQQQQQQIVVPSSELPDFLFGFDSVAAAQEVIVESSGSSSNSPNNSLKMIIEADSAMQSGLPPICTVPAVAICAPPAMRAILVPPAVLQPQNIPQSPPQMLQNPLQVSQNLPQPKVSQNLPQPQVSQNLPQPQVSQNLPQPQAQQNLPQPQLQQALQQNMPQPQPQLQQTLQQNLPQPQQQNQQQPVQQQNLLQPQQQNQQQQVQQQNMPQHQQQQVQQQNLPQHQQQQVQQQNMPQPQQQNQQQQVVLPPRGPKTSLKSDKKEPKNNKDNAGSPKKSEHKMNSNSNNDNAANNRQIQIQKEYFDQQDVATSPDSMKIKQRSLDASPESNSKSDAVDEHEIPVKVKRDVDNKQQDGEGKQRNVANPREGSADNNRIERQEVSLNVFMEQQKLQEEQQLKMENKTSGDDDNTKKSQRQEQVFGIQQQQQHRLEDYTQQQQHLLKQQQQHLLMQQQNQQMATLSPQQQQQFQQQFQHQPPYFIENNVIYYLTENQPQQQQQQIIQRPAVLVNQDGVPIQRVSSDPLAFPRSQPVVAAPIPRQMSAQFVDQAPKQQVPSHVRMVYPARMGSPSRFCEPPPPPQQQLRSEQQQQFEVSPAMTLRAPVPQQQQPAFIIRQQMQQQQQQGGSLHVIDPRMVASSQQMAFTTSEKI